MSRYWVIAPYESKSELFEKVWEFDKVNKTISIGWGQFGDIASLDFQALNSLIIQELPRSKAAKMIWSFYHEMGRDTFETP